PLFRTHCGKAFPYSNFGGQAPRKSNPCCQRNRDCILTTCPTRGLLSSEPEDAMAELKVVILDIDGTLLVSNAAHALAFTEAAECLGMEADYSKILGLIGKGGDRLIPEAFGVDESSALGTKLDHLKGQ